MPIQLVFWNHLNRTAQQGLQLPGKRQALGEQVIAAVELYEEIDIAVGSLFAARH